MTNYTQALISFMLILFACAVYPEVIRVVLKTEVEGAQSSSSSDFTHFIHVYRVKKKTFFPLRTIDPAYRSLANYKYIFYRYRLNS